MANALAPMMPAPHKMALPSSGLQTPEYLSPTAPVPPPVAPRAMPNALSAPNAYMGAPKKPQNEMLGAAVRGFQRGFDPAGFEKQREDAKTAGQEKAKQTLALMQQQRQLPEAQRTQWWQQNAATIGGIIGQDISQQQVDPAQFSDQALDGQIAALSGQLGIAPATPEPMSAYQAEQIKLEQEKAGRPQGVNLGDGAYAQYNPETGQLEMLRDAPLKEDPANYDTVTMADGIWAVNKRNPKDKIRIGAAPPRTSGSAGQQPPSGYRWKADGTLEKIPGGPADKPAGPAYDAATARKFLNQAQTLDSLDGAINQYMELIQKHGPQIQTSGIGGDNVVAAQLDAARTAIDIQTKELFNLGVLNGPDLDIIRGAIPDVTGFEAWGKTGESVGASMNVLRDYISRGRNQIPPEIVARARPNASQGEKPAQGAAGASAAGSAMSGLRNQIMRAAQQDDGQDDDMDGFVDSLFGDEGGADEVPDGVDPADWEYFTPEMKQQFLQGAQ